MPREVSRAQTTNRRQPVSAVAPHLPYHAHGELTLLLVFALLGIFFLLLPLPIFVRLFGAIALFTVLPANLLQEYWPKLRLHDLGWQLPLHPRSPHLYSAVVIILSFFPLLVFLLVKQPDQYVAVDPTIGWIPWLLAEAVVAILVIAQAAFFSGLLLFRLTHLMKPWAAIILVGLMLAIGQFFVPGIVRYLAVPFTIALAWMAWQTKSFVPVAATQILVTIIYDLIIRLS